MEGRVCVSLVALAQLQHGGVEDEQGERPWFLLVQNGAEERIGFPSDDGVVVYEGCVLGAFALAVTRRTL